MPRQLIVTVRQFKLQEEQRKRRHIWHRQRNALGAYAVQHGATRAAKAFNVPLHLAKYWRTKANDASFHPRPWGGVEYSPLKYGEEGDELIQALLWRNVQLHPEYNLHDHAQKLHRQGVPDITKCFLARIFRNWRWSWKKPTIQHINKYSTANIAYYAQWVSVIPQLPLERLKFCDESHFVSRHLHRHQAVGPIGTQTYLRDSADLTDSFSLTLLLDLTNETNPFFMDMRASSNTEFDFLAFVCAAVDAGRLCRGDFFIVDNASIHFGEATRHYLRHLFALHGISYLFLPTYSPELNPCELVFAFVKRYIRDHRSPNDHVHRLLLAALACLPLSDVKKFYWHCVHIQDRIVH